MFYDFYRNSIGFYIVILSYIIVDFLWSLDNPAGNIGGVLQISRPILGDSEIYGKIQEPNGLK
jgi:hypothetical protein